MVASHWTELITRDAVPNSCPLLKSLPGRSPDLARERRDFDGDGKADLTVYRPHTGPLAHDREQDRAAVAYGAPQSDSRPRPTFRDSLLHNPSQRQRDHQDMLIRRRSTQFRLWG
jgi:hypothetical protein